MRNALLALLIHCFFATSLLAATAHSVIVDGVIEADFRPSVVYFFVSLNDGPVRLQQGLLLEAGSTEGERYHTGTVVKSDTPVTQLQYSVLAQGKDNQFWVKHYPIESLNPDHTRLQSVEGLRASVLLQKRKLVEEEERGTEDAETLRRLRADAEIIGNLGRISRLMEQVNLLKEQKQHLIEDEARLKNFLKQASTQEAPNNFIRRQAELTSQLEELARLVQGVEEGEVMRRSLSESELQRQLALIEETRMADANDLQSQLTQLQTARKRLESELGVDAGESIENYLSW